MAAKAPTRPVSSKSGHKLSLKQLEDPPPPPPKFV
jgi:hypothetical protein